MIEVKEEDIIAAIKTGDKASEILDNIISELSEDYSCPYSYGFEGRDTYPECGECIVCISKKIRGVKE